MITYPKIRDMPMKWWLKLDMLKTSSDPIFFVLLSPIRLERLNRSLREPGER